MTPAQLMTAKLNQPETPPDLRKVDLRSIADRADDALRNLAKARSPLTLSEWVELAAPIAALILAARTL